MPRDRLESVRKGFLLASLATSGRKVTAQAVGFREKFGLAFESRLAQRRLWFPWESAVAAKYQQKTLNPARTHGHCPVAAAIPQAKIWIAYLKGTTEEGFPNPGEPTAAGQQVQVCADWPEAYVYPACTKR